MSDTCFNCSKTVTNNTPHKTIESPIFGTIRISYCNNTCKSISENNKNIKHIYGSVL
jgi:hypothetical protein